tara:strand:- start:214 stop:324 length:111 start_codon:yes stop_codon:yes gene_type:complete
MAAPLNPAEYMARRRKPKAQPNHPKIAEQQEGKLQL